MKTIYVGYDGTRVEIEQADIEIRVPMLFRYYKTMDGFSLFINPEPERYRQMLKNLKKHPDSFIYGHGSLVCPTKEFSNPEAWIVEGLENMPDEMHERMEHYWKGYTEHWFKTYCCENTVLWRGTDTTLGTKVYLNDTVIPEASDCTFILSGEYNGIRFSKLSNVLIHIFGNYYEVD